MFVACRRAPPERGAGRDGEGRGTAMRTVRSWLSVPAAGCRAARRAALGGCVIGALALPPVASAQDVSLFTTIGITQPGTSGKSQISGGYSFRGQEMPSSGAVITPPNDATDDVTLRMPDTSGNVANLAAFRGQELELRETERGAYSRIHFFGTTTDGGPAGGAFTFVTTTGRARPRRSSSATGARRRTPRRTTPRSARRPGATRPAAGTARAAPSSTCRSGWRRARRSPPWSSHRRRRPPAARSSPT